MRIIIIIDMQRDFIDGSLGTPEAEIAAENAIQWLKENMDDWDAVFMTRDTHYDDYLETPEGKKLPVKHCIRETDGWKIHPEFLKITEENLMEIFNKPTFGCRALINNVMDFICNRDIPGVEIVFMGLCTDICVISNVLMMKEALGCLDIPIKVLSDCCAGVTPEKHEAALEVMRSCQIDVIKREELV